MICWVALDTADVAIVLVVVAAGTDSVHRAGPGSAGDHAAMEVSGSVLPVPGWLPVTATTLLARTGVEGRESDGWDHCLAPAVLDTVAGMGYTG